jgi:hypothetical protein
MLKVDKEWIDRVDGKRPGFREMVECWDAMELPPCPSCGSADTAQVSAGLVGRSIHLAVATTKIRLLPNGHPADYYCNQCQSYFNGPDGGHVKDIGGTYKVTYAPSSGRARGWSSGRRFRG